MNLVFDHIGILSKDINEGRRFLENTLMITHWGEPILDPIQQVVVQFGKSHKDSSAGVVYELITPSNDKSPISNALKNKKSIINHFAYRVADIKLAGEHLQKNRCFALTQTAPATAFSGREIQFFYSPMDFIIEIIEADELLLNGGVS